jgi:hypothetical protein
VPVAYLRSCSPVIFQSPPVRVNHSRERVSPLSTADPLKRAQSKRKRTADEFVLQMPIGYALEIFSRNATKRDTDLTGEVYQRFADIIEEFRSIPGITGKNVTLATLEFATFMAAYQLEEAAEPSPSAGKLVSFPACR